ncbi:MAG: hypothetical protein ACREJB_08705, partial [Planctomycetaceae bacterium]
MRIPFSHCWLVCLLAVAAWGCGRRGDLAVAEQDPASGPAKERPANRLARESSPYLLLHAHNPV